MGNDFEGPGEPFWFWREIFTPDLHSKLENPVDQKFLTKDIFFREFELKKMGEGLKEA